MSAGIIGYDNRGGDGFPSPAVWADCPNTLLNDKGLGYFIHHSGIGNVNTLPPLREDSDAATYTYDDGANGDNRTVNAATGAGTDNHALAIHTSPLAKVVKNSGTKVWAETDIALAAIADQALFFGLAESAALDRDVVSDNPGNNAQAGLDSESLIGFVTQQNSSATDKLDAVYRKDDGSVVDVLTDATNATALSSRSENGTELQSDLRADLAADTFVRLGVYFNGRDKLQFFVKGVKVAEQTVDSTVDQSKEYGVVLALKNGTAAERTVRYRFFRAAAQVRS
jgi:hypothetical protein